MNRPSDVSRPERGGRSDDNEIVLGLLSAIEQNKDVTQRSLAGELNIIVGLAKTYLKRLVREGPVKVQQVPLLPKDRVLTPTFLRLVAEPEDETEPVKPPQGLP